MKRLAHPAGRARAVAAMLVGLAALTISCASAAGRARAGDVASSGRHVRDAGEVPIRVLLSASRATARIAGPGLVFLDRNGRVVARGTNGASWRAERDAGRVRVVRSDGVPTVWVDGPMTVRNDDGAPVEVDGRAYRGELLVYGGDEGVVIINRLKIDEYLRGVVPREIGTRAESDFAAIQAQAVAARTYAFMNLASGDDVLYDVTSTVRDQVYGGVAVETAIADRAIESTQRLVVTYAGRVVNAPYHSTCGGSTAAASEVWRSGDEPYLQPVSDRIPGTNRYYCDISPSFRWTRTLDARTLDAALAKYLADYAEGGAIAARAPGHARDVEISSRTGSGRVGALTITTDRGNFTVRGNDTRYVLRPPGGAILHSTYYSVEVTNADNGTISRLTIRGTGNGHGVGMCQWGAIGRARAGQDFRTILATYYPGTSVGTAG